MRNMDISNGEGIGAALFVQGCNHRCKGCFNSDTWDFSGGNEWTQEVKDEFLKLIDKPHIKRVSILGGCPLADENVEDVFELIKDIKRLYPTKKIWLYTGYTWEETMSYESELKHAKDTLEQNSNQRYYRIYKDSMFTYKPDSYTLRKEIISLCDILVDGRYIDELRDLTLKFRGSSNQRLIDVKKSLEQNEVVLWSK